MSLLRRLRSDVDVHADLQGDVIATGVGFLAEVGVLAGYVEFADDMQHALVDGGLEARHGQRPVLDRQRAFDRAVARNSVVLNSALGYLATLNHSACGSVSSCSGTPSAAEPVSIVAVMLELSGAAGL